MGIIMNMEDMNKKMGQVIAKVWSDEEFKARLLANPAETLRAEGIEIPAGVKVDAVENTDEHFHLVIPQRPDDLSDEQLDNAAGGRYVAPAYCNPAICF
jgi:hypothetical protein